MQELPQPRAPLASRLFSRLWLQPEVRQCMLALAKQGEEGAVKVEVARRQGVWRGRQGGSVRTDAVAH